MSERTTNELTVVYGTASDEQLYEVKNCIVLFTSEQYSLQLNICNNSFSLTFPIFPDFSLTTFQFPDFSRFSRFSRRVATLVLVSIVR